jgi:acetyl/propionyl-CoA carboxylase alpha subunit
MRLQRVLIANRGEIAIRLINSCNKLAITSIAIYTEEDASSMHVRCADEAYQLSGTGSRGYLDASSIIRICNENRIDAVIPGYGFLSENAEFAECLRDAGVLFVGPGPDTLKDFGLKDRARELAIRVNVPVLPGTELIESEKEAERQASILGFPVGYFQNYIVIVDC